MMGEQWTCVDSFDKDTVGDIFQPGSRDSLCPSLQLFLPRRLSRCSVSPSLFSARVNRAAVGFTAALWKRKGKRRRGGEGNVGGESLSVKCHGCCNDKVRGDFTGKCHHVSMSVPLDSPCEGHT